jgi:uncharacterized membrane protein YgcG
LHAARRHIDQAHKSMSLTSHPVRKEHHMPVPAARRQPSRPRFALATLMSLLLLVLVPAASQAATGSISGTVKDPGGAPITSDVCVVAGRVPLTSDTFHFGYGEVGAGGHYVITELPDGPYSLSFRNCGDERDDLDQYLSAAVTVTAGAAVTAPDVVMHPATAIRGHVYGGSGNGAPLSNVCVSAVIGSGGYPGDPEYPGYPGYPSYPGYGTNYVTAAWAFTSADGSYVLKHLDPGQTYKLLFNACPGVGGGGYGAQFYDAVSDYSQAATLRPTVAHPSLGIDGHLPSLDAAPVTTITGGPAPNAVTNQTSARFAFVADRLGATFECAIDGGAYTSCASPFSRNGLAAGAHSFSVRAHSFGKVDAHPPSVSWTVNPSSQTSTSHGTVTAGGTFSSDADAAPTAAVPVVASVTLPSAGSVTLIKQPATTPSGNGYTVFGRQIDITATASDGSGAVTGSVANPIVLSFQIAGSQIPAGTDPAAVTVLRNGSPAPSCASDDGTASPDPCISNRRQLADGGLAIEVLTTHCSTWNFAVTSAVTVDPPVVPPPVDGGGGGNSGGGGAGGGGSAGGGGTKAKAPVLTFGPLRGLHLARFLRSGLAVRLSCAAPCRADVKLTVSAAVGRRLGLSKRKGKALVVVGSASAKLTNKQKSVVVRLSAKAKKALRKYRRPVKVTVVVLARNAGGTTTLTRALTVRH